MIELVTFKEEDFDRFKSWIKSKDELLQFAGPIFTYPLTHEQLITYIHDNRRKSFKIVHTGTDEVIGHCELNLENKLPRLSRILIADSNKRGKGLGKLVVNKMLNKLFIEAGYTSADLTVFDWNTAAIKCYEQVGFQINPATINTQNNNGEEWTALNMVINKEKWIQIKQ